MFPALLSGIRSLRVSLVTGAILVGSIYIFIYDLLVNAIAVRQSARSLFEISSYMPIILIIFLCVTVGSLYTTLLEGIVDRLHRKTVHREIVGKSPLWERIILRSFLPYSDSARKRLVEEVVRFNREYSSHDESENSR